MIKNSIVCTGLILFGLMQANAQDFAIGFKGGFDLVDFRVTNLPAGHSFSSTPRWSFAVTIHQQLRKSRLGIRLDPGYMERGSVYENGYSSTRANIRLRYLHLPFLFSYTPVKHFYIEAGPEFGYYLNGYSGSSSTAFVDYSVYDHKKVTVSAIIGWSCYLHQRINGGMRYSIGLDPIAEIVHTDQSGVELSRSKQYSNYVEVFMRFYMINVKN